MEQEMDILIQYGEADINKKLHLFLQFPDLRSGFQEIERKKVAFQTGFKSLLEEQKSAKGRSDQVRLGDLDRGKESSPRPL